MLIQVSIVKSPVPSCGEFEGGMTAAHWFCPLKFSPLATLPGTWAGPAISKAVAPNTSSLAMLPVVSSKGHQWVMPGGATTHGTSGVLVAVAVRVAVRVGVRLAVAVRVGVNDGAGVNVGSQFTPGGQVGVAVVQGTAPQLVGVAVNVGSQGWGQVVGVEVLLGLGVAVEVESTGGFVAVDVGCGGGSVAVAVPVGVGEAHLPVPSMSTHGVGVGDGQSLELGPHGVDVGVAVPQ